MSEMNKKPKIRFKGYTDAWEQRKLGELINDFSYGLNAAAKEYDGINKYLRITDIDEQSNQFNQNNVTTPNIDLSNCDNYLLTEGDLLFARTGASVGKTYMYRNTDGKVYYAGFLIKGSVLSNTDVSFVFQNTMTKNYKNFVTITSQRSGQPGINATEYATYKLYVPNSLQEQSQIGSFFSELDHLITLHQRKLEQLKNTKKSMLLKMFPAEGSQYPEIRFAGYTDAWEQRKLGELATTFSGGTPSVGVKEYYNGNIPFIRSAEINANVTELFISELALKNSSARLVEKGNILYALYGATSGEVGISKINGAINQAILAIIPIQETNAEFLMYWLNKNKNKIIKTYLQGGQGNLSGSIVKNLIISLPKYDEQKKIGEYLTDLDHLITLHQRKLEKLEKVKKSMLENMFV
ncbi:type I restriction enzyme, S subunit [Granulicatella balaenopterae]|uniref:Type I restriction enzyme, S subunit n=1 Tax=Granulicatella balaenopterae TaxID=137733 RepID=A0A1H9GP92_9LACT|nr:restriction endonuclease subunit S [Granulicatella balaenopterae]SEQ51945.1 type I restriction enzyme, S subunit [Granulicatella balaenopterae]